HLVAALTCDRRENEHAEPRDRFLRLAQPVHAAIPREIRWLDQSDSPRRGDGAHERDIWEIAPRCQANIAFAFDGVLARSALCPSSPMSRARPRARGSSY